MRTKKYPSGTSKNIASLYRARLAREKGTIRKDWGGRISVALVYPNFYRIGMSNLGFQVVYNLFNKRKDVVAERFFSPEGPEMSLYVRTGKDIVSLESGMPLREFDIVAFSLSFENDYPNILKILELGKIPLLLKERDASHPFIMAGGITTFLNPEPLAPFFDFFLLGEAEANLEEFIETFSGIRHVVKNRKELRKALARNIKSIYVPSLYRIEYHKDGTIKSRDPVESNIPEKIEVPRYNFLDNQVSTSGIISRDSEFADRVLIELGRGCGHSCRFCAAGYVYRPPRVHNESDLLACIDNVMTDCSNLGLLSAAVSDTPGIENITDRIIDKGGRFSVSSLRADSLTGELLEHLKKAGQKTIAIAPEAGSERLRKVVNKRLSQKRIIESARLIASSKNFTLRLYFLIGLPTESHEDVVEIREVVKAIKHNIVNVSKSRGRVGQIKLSVNCFIPKPFTPFQWFPLEDISTLKEKQQWLKKELRMAGGIKVNFDLPKWAYLQALLSMGDRRVASILLLAHSFRGDWTRTLRSSELTDFFVYRPKGLSEILPWDFINHGISKQYLIKEYNLALEGKESEPCSVGDCVRCGVCSQ